MADSLCCPSVPSQRHHGRVPYSTGVRRPMSKGRVLGTEETPLTGRDIGASVADSIVSSPSGLWHIEIEREFTHAA
jgi:hypothetical protein